jgi:uncharacterized protein YcbX
MEARKNVDGGVQHAFVRTDKLDASSPDSVGESAQDVVQSIWRYPVKSMAGEQLESVRVSPKGVVGDRVYAFVNEESNRTAVVRKWAENFLNYHPHFVTEPTADAEVPLLQITMPSGETLTSDTPLLEERISELFEHKLKLMSSAPAGVLIEVPAGTLGGSMSGVTEFPLGGGATPGAFVDYGSLHLIASSTMDHFQKAYPQGRFDVRRFRPNIVIQTQADALTENTWVGRTLAIGNELVLRVTIPCPRCISVTLAQDDLPRDPGILRAIAEHNMCDLGDFGTLPCAGVYADVVRAGRIQWGDTLRFLD